MLLIRYSFIPLVPFVAQIVGGKKKKKKPHQQNKTPKQTQDKVWKGKR